jgi:hypothetical protein
MVLYVDLELMVAMYSILVLGAVLLLHVAPVAPLVLGLIVVVVLCVTILREVVIVVKCVRLKQNNIKVIQNIII